MAKEAAECVIAADRTFVTRIKLSKMDIFDAYASRMRLLASDIEAGRETGGEATRARYIGIRTDLFRGIEAAYAADEARRARIAAGMAAMGAGLQQAGAAYSPSPAPLNCTTIPLYQGASQTTCR